MASEAAALQQLDQTRTSIVALVARLAKRLRAEEISSIGRIFQGGAHATYGAWAGAFLNTMGVSGCHANMVAVVSWQVAEFTQAAWNPLATTYPMPGSTLFNGSGVRNYVSAGQGLEATRLTIRGGMDRYGYGRIVSSLAACADAMTTARAINASSWCRGCAGGTYVVGMVPKVEAELLDVRGALTSRLTSRSLAAPADRRGTSSARGPAPPADPDGRSSRIAGTGGPAGRTPSAPAPGGCHPW